MLAQTRFRDAVAGYRGASKSPHGTSSRQSRRGLDWMNFFIADVQTGFGTYVAFYLTQNGWSEGNTGFGADDGGIAGVLSQIPGGASCDALIWKRGFGRSRNCYYRRSRVILAFSHSFIPVLCAELLHGVTAGIITAAVGAISLALVGRRTMSLRTGRNYQYAAGGHAVTAAMMGLPDAYYSPGAMFVSAGMLCVPALIALNFIRPEEIDYARARNAKTGQHTQKIDRALDLAKNRPLVLFAAAMTLFQLAEASTLPLNISRPRPDKDRCRSRSSSSFRRSWWRLFLHGQGITLKRKDVGRSY